MTEPESHQTPLAALDKARADLANLWSAPTGSHPETYESIHQVLSETLSSIDSL